MVGRGRCGLFRGHEFEVFIDVIWLSVCVQCAFVQKEQPWLRFRNRGHNRGYGLKFGNDGLIDVERETSTVDQSRLRVEVQVSKRQKGTIASTPCRVPSSKSWRSKTFWASGVGVDARLIKKRF